MRRLPRIVLLPVTILSFILVLAVYRHAQAATTLIVPDNYPTIQAAIDAALPGDTILVRAGTYFENLTLNKPLTLTGEAFDPLDPTRNPTIIDGRTVGATITIPTGVSPMPTIRGFVIRHGTDGILARSEFIAEYNYLLQSSGDLNDYGQGSGGINRGNVYFDSGDDSIDLDDMDHPLVIEDNRMMYSGDDGIEIRLQDASAPAQPIAITIRNNQLIGSQEDGLQFIDYSQQNDTQRRFEVVGNLIADSVDAGIGLMPNQNTVENFSGADILEAIRVYSNTLYGNNYGISGGDNLVAFNNIIVNSTTRGVWRVQGPSTSNSVVAYTLFYNNGTDAEKSTLGAGNLLGQNPLFTSAPGPGPDGLWGTVDDDFSGLVLQANSPAINAGVTQYTASDGEAIPPAPITGFSGAAPDLGWKEFNSPQAATATQTATRTPTPSLTPASSGAIRFAVIGDYGSAGQPELDVSNLVKSWDPDFVITTGDNNYSLGEASTIDKNIGQYYHEFIYPYTGAYGAGATTNRFFPSLGNHDWNTTGAQPYLDYFTLPGNERYYDFVWGPVHFFAIDSDGREPDGNSSTSTQGVWLQNQLGASTSPWNLVYMHHPPYSSGANHGSTTVMQWPYQAWGADVVLAGHDHTYERILLNGFPYFVDGLGGKSIYTFSTPVPGSQVRYNGDYGAILVDADTTQIEFQFFSRTGLLIDTYVLGVPAATFTPTPTWTSTPTPVASATPTHTPTSTDTLTNTPTDTPTGTLTNTPTRTATPTDTPTNTPTSTPTPTLPPPSVPLLVSPANGIVLLDYAPTLDWTDQSPAPDHFVVQVATANTFAPSVLVFNQQVIASSFPITPPLAAGKTYYWRARAVGGLGQASAWSAVRYFKTGWLPPALNSPSNTEELPSKRPAFTWIAVTGAGNYTLQVSKYSNLSSPQLNVTINGMSYTPRGDLAANTRYYWRMRTNGTNGPSAWSSVWNFKTANPPSTPALLRPANGALTTDYTPRLDWADSSLPLGTAFDHYQLQVDADPSFASPDLDEQISPIASSEFTPLSDLIPNTKYSWRVRAFNDANQFSAWSAVRTFRAAILPPALVSPSNGSTPDNLRPLFDWTDVPGAASYSLVVSRYSNLSSPFLNLTLGSSSSAYTPARDLPPGRTLYWRVRANGPNGPSLWTAGSFTTPRPPSIPALVSPASNTLTTSANVTLIWKASLPVSPKTIAHYELQVDTNTNTFVSPEVDETALSGLSYNLTLVPGNLYYWRVRAVDSDLQKSSWSAVRVVKARMSPPVLVSPADSRTAANPVSFDWGDVNGASNYTIQVSTASNFSSYLLNTTAPGSQYTMTRSLPVGKTLYWRVRANGRTGPSSWSTVFRMTIP